MDGEVIGLYKQAGQWKSSLVREVRFPELHVHLINLKGWLRGIGYKTISMNFTVGLTGTWGL